MPNVQILKIAGLHTNNNELSAVPDGALAIADNVVIRAKDTLEPRRGQYKVGTLSNGALQAMTYGDSFVFNESGGGLSYVSALGTPVSYSDPQFPPTDQQRMRSLEASGNFYFTTNRGIYKLDNITNQPTPAGAPKTADLTEQFTPTRFIGDTSPGFLNSGFKCAYRVTFVKKDANKNLLVGSPSGRCFATNLHPTDTSNVLVQVPLPSWLGDDNSESFVRVYRTAQTPFNTDPGDEMFLVKETKLLGPFTPGAIYSFTDRQPDDMRGLALYTNNNSGEGILQANEPPPMANDICFWNNRAWYANTKQPERLFLDILGTGKGSTGATGLRLGDVITVAGQKFVGYFDGDGETFPTSGYKSFGVYSQTYGTATTGSVAGDIELTARNFVKALNSETNVTTVPIRAYYISGANDVPGKIVIEAREPNTNPFSVSVESYAQQIYSISRVGTTVTVTTRSMHGKDVGDTVLMTADVINPDFPVGTKTVTARLDNYRFTYTESGAATSAVVIGSNYRVKVTSPNPGLAWNPELPKTDGSSGFTVTSEAEEEVQRLYYSKLQQPESVPLVNWIDVGIKGRKILRVIPLRDKLFVLKEDGIYLVSGEAPFIVDLLDNTVRLIAPDSACSVSNQIYCLTNQGVVSVSEAGVNVISRAIEPDIIKLFSPSVIDFTKTTTFGISRETDRMYELWLPSAEDSGPSTVQAFVYNTMLGVWTRGAVLDRSCGIVNQFSDILYMGDINVNGLYTERRSLDYTDYYDEFYPTVSVSSFEPYIRTFTTTFTYDYLKIGDVFYDYLSPGPLFKIIGKSVGAGGVITFTYEDMTAPVTGTPPTIISVYSSIPCRVEWATQQSSSANDLKQFTETKFVFRNATFIKAQATFGTDVIPTRSEISFLGGATDLNEGVNWGFYDLPFERRVLVDQPHQYATFFRPGFKLAEALSYWVLSGICINFQPQGTITGQ